MIKIIIAVIIILIGLVLILAGYFGAFTRVSVKEESKKTLWLIYEKFTGPYQNTGPVMDELYYRLLNNDSIETFNGFGIYYDNPREVDANKCRSIVGSILEENDYNRIDELKNKYNIMEITESKGLSSQFPYRGKLSIMMGIMKVYPEINRKIESLGIKQKPIMEIYNIPEKKIYYFMAMDPEFPNE
ncbi:MAG: GyrI-like domain-containing protein [Spirochaetales bacterium]|nr:GyrI-like domain-containing protein [Spirochaetales bacterium]